MAHASPVANSATPAAPRCSTTGVATAFVATPVRFGSTTCAAAVTSTVSDGVLTTLGAATTATTTRTSVFAALVTAFADAFGVAGQPPGGAGITTTSADLACIFPRGTRRTRLPVAPRLHRCWPASTPRPVAVGTATRPWRRFGGWPTISVATWAAVAPTATSPTSSPPRSTPRPTPAGGSASAPTLAVAVWSSLTTPLSPTVWAAGTGGRIGGATRVR
mmetsp:Transcript_82727/g.124190  ORF Transcript_82727/g.124190 Transcript_82727/m.124190 type:complete len:219 (-) Transcript_82727:1191-1847(-)